MPQQRVETPFNLTKSDLITLINESVDELATLGDGDYIVILCIEACNDTFYATVNSDDATTLKGNLSTYVNAIPCVSLTGTLTMIYTYA
jgi:hypothetical protein